MNRKIIIGTSILLTSSTVVFVFCRLFGTPIIWGLDISRFLYIWLTFFAVYEAIKGRNHISVDSFLDFLEKRGKTKTLATMIKIREGLTFLFFAICTVLATQFSWSYY